MTPALADEVARVAAALSDVAGALFTLDSAPDMHFVQAQAAAGNPAAVAITQQLAARWSDYSTVKAAVDQLITAASARDSALAQRLLSSSAVALEHGRATGTAAAVDNLAREVAALEVDTTSLASTARDALTKLDAAASDASDLERRARLVGCDADIEVVALRNGLGAAKSALATNPLDAAPVEALLRLVAAVRNRVEQAEDDRHALPAELVAAAATLAEIEKVVAAGSDAYEQTRDRIANPVGLLQPLDVGSAGERALRPWLDRIRTEAKDGDMASARRGLLSWQTVAADWLASARAVHDANRAPLARRDELRGLLEAFEAKASRSGAAEDASLTRAYERAHEALFTKPCDLLSAQALVDRYVETVNATLRGQPR